MMFNGKPDRLEYVVRFVCGALGGVEVGLWSAVGTEWTAGETLIAVVLPALIFGGCAALFGDRFWRRRARLANLW